MIYLKENPIGIDAVLQQVQQGLYDNLQAIWGTELEVYGRSYLNEKNGKSTIEAFIKDNDYSGNLIVGDKSKFFFLEQGYAVPNGLNRYTQEIDVIFILDLSKCKPSIAHRADAEVHADVEFELRKFSYLNLSIVSFATKIQNVFKEIRFRYMESLDFKYIDDMHPFHTFKFKINVAYEMQQEYC